MLLARRTAVGVAKWLMTSGRVWNVKMHPTAYIYSLVTLCCRKFVTGKGKSIVACCGKTKWRLIIITVILMAAPLGNTGFCRLSYCFTMYAVNQSCILIHTACWLLPNFVENRPRLASWRLLCPWYAKRCHETPHWPHRPHRRQIQVLGIGKMCLTRCIGAMFRDTRIQRLYMPWKFTVISPKSLLYAVKTYL